MSEHPRKGIDDALQAGQVPRVLKNGQADEYLGQIGQAAAKGQKGAPGSDIREAVDDPHALARSFMKPAGGDARFQVPRHWRGEWYTWREGAYRRLEEADVRADLVKHVRRVFEEDFRDRQEEAREKAREKAQGEGGGEQGEGKGPGTVLKVSRQLIANVVQALASIGNLPSRIEAPAWLGGDAPWPADECIVAPNRIVHLPSLVRGMPQASIPTTPGLFVASTLGCPFAPFRCAPTVPTPTAWFRFLHEMWPNDPEAISALQEWFGYCLAPDTSQHKMLAIVGPKRSGKGTIARVLSALLGAGATATPTLSSLAGPFGLQPLLGKSLATITDARLSARTDVAQIVERLLSISGEDGQDVHRKHLPTLSVPRLPLRFMILTNELPRLWDASGALVGRLIILRQTRSFYGAEDLDLGRRLLGELEAILLWAIEGWRRLRDRGRFVQPASGAQMASEMEDLSSPVRAFVRDRCEIGPDLRVSVADLFAAWKGWCEEMGHKPGNEAVFGRDLRAVLPSLGTAQPRAPGRRYRVFVGVRARPPEEVPLEGEDVFG